MNPTTVRLDQLSPRVLNLLGSIFCDGDVRVVASPRAAHPLAVALDSRTVVLDPNCAGLYDLALGARLLRHRALRHQGPADLEKRDRWLTRRAHRTLVPAAQAALRRDFPGIDRLRGRYRPGADLDGLRLSVRSVAYRPPPDLPPPPAAVGGGPPREVPWHERPWGASGFEMHAVPELEITGAADDFDWLLAQIAAGHIAPQSVPGLPELPFVRVPYRLLLSEADSPVAETYEEQLADPENRDTIQGLMDCYRRKSEVRQERLFLGGRARVGVHLDSGRLVEAALAARTGLEPRLFRRRGSVVEPVFDPREHLVAISFDLNDLRRSRSWFDLERRRGAQRFVACILTAFERLGVDCVVSAFADQIVELADGRRVCLHLTNELKPLDGTFDGAFRSRLAHLLAHPPEFPGEAACFHPLSLRDLTSAFDAAAREQDHSYRATVWWARRGMPDRYAEYLSADFQMRTADHIDAEVREVGRRHAGTLDTLMSFLPADLRAWGRPGEFLDGIEVG